MQRLISFFKLVRWQNLLFIALSQALFYYCILLPVFKNKEPVFTVTTFLLLLFASVAIAAAGYIINDYFDINIDQINKPEKLFVGKTINRRWAILWHSLLSFIGVVISFYISVKTKVYWIGFANLFCTFLLFIYSTSFKRKFLSGNIIISALTSWSVAVVGFASFYAVLKSRSIFNQVSASEILTYTVIYASFAFIISLVREAIKDVEDMEGDLKFGCKTMPIVIGLNATKTYIAVWLVVLIGAIAILQIYAFKYQWWLAILYSVLMLILPLVNILLQLLAAQKKEDFHKLSNLAKLLMLSGILSMVFFKLYL